MGTTRRLAATASLLALVSGYLSPWPVSIILISTGALIAIVLVASKPKESDLAAQASAACDADLMTVWEVAELSGMSPKAVVMALDRDGMVRADRLGWRAKLPVSTTRIRYRRADVARWLNTR